MAFPHSRFPLGRLALTLSLAGFGSLAPNLAAQAASEVAASTRLHFELAPGPLDQVLLNLSQQSGETISFDQRLLQGRRSSAVIGDFTADEAMSQALRGTDLTFSRNAQGTLIVLPAAVQDARALPSAPPPRSAAQAPQLDQVVVLGTRRSDVTALSSSAPVDIIDAQQLERTGATTINQALERLTPSFNFPQSGGTGLSAWNGKSASLRGLSPDQTLVLVNGKRRHASAYVKVQEDWGYGSQPVDISTLPISAVDHIEVLRDGASAQYGSDAIAGVVNIVLRKDASGGHFATQVGQYRQGDGLSREVNGWKGWQLGEDGFFNVSFDGTRNNPTDRGYDDNRQFYFSGDPREATADRDKTWGASGMRKFNLAFNGEVGLSEQLRAYSFGTFGRTFNEVKLLFVRPQDNGTVRSIYPDGFMPELTVRQDDVAGTVGLKYDLGEEGRFDLSATYGQNRQWDWIDNTVNASLGAASPTHFYNGERINAQSVLNLDYTRDLNIAALRNPVTLSTGIGAIEDRYALKAGDTASWINGGQPVIGNPILDGSGTLVPAPAGAQAYSGLTPTDASTSSRHSFNAYFDLESQFTEQFQAGLALRQEHYSDFGDATTGKLSARYDFTPQVAVRATASTGFRAPTLGQQYTSSTSLTFFGNEVFQSRTLPVASGAAKALGASDLKAEKSRSLSLGLVLRPTTNTDLSIDAYQIGIRDRITPTQNLTGAYVQGVLAGAGYSDIGSARFYTNAMDTMTRGVDVVGHYRPELSVPGKLELSLGYSRSKTTITGIAPNPGALAGSNLVLIGRQIQGLIEDASPESKLVLGALYRWQDWDLNLSQVRYGRYTYTHANDPALDQRMSPQWVTNLDITHHLTDALSLSVGANNLFDSYPDKLLPGNRSRGVSKYTSLAPDGFNGAFYYVRASYDF
ncbi:TonB-dependent receptor [Pseudomonas entomophila]|uniref:TonB-dependent receptor n=1 Tax=Pseudomonas entomophila TaxID=312306 RepID=UPI0023D887D2|nr:TonB-dependent receptor [Pseudomonas entomophila]MDF0731392.1 TonB-dependent receptor [Pseudomonas entomophila]